MRYLLCARPASSRPAAGDRVPTRSSSTRLSIRNSRSRSSRFHRRRRASPVLPKFDAESTKTVGLTTALIAEADRPRCDVFWNNEILNTLRLEEQGLLDVYRSPAAEELSADVPLADGTWHGFAARARILIVNTELVPRSERPKSIYDLLDRSGRARSASPSRCSAPRPRTPLACSPCWGDEKAEGFLPQAQGQRRANHVRQQASRPGGGRRARSPSA